jgi:CRP-like cAMP-binding protein
MIGESSPASSYNTSVAMEFFRFASKPKAFAKGKKIFTENQRGIPFLLMPNRMYLLLDGEVGIFSRDRPVATVRPGQIFGEMASIDQGPRTGTAMTKSACRVIALDNRQLQTALGRYPEFALMLMSVMIGRLRESIGRLGGPESPVTGTRRESAPLRKDLIEDLARVLGSDAHLSYETGATIVREGQVGVLMYIVLKGKVAIRVGGNVVETVGPGGAVRRNGSGRSHTAACKRRRGKQLQTARDQPQRVSQPGEAQPPLRRLAARRRERPRAVHGLALERSSLK